MPFHHLGRTKVRVCNCITDLFVLNPVFLYQFSNSDQPAKVRISRETGNGRDDMMVLSRYQPYQNLSSNDDFKRNSGLLSKIVMDGTV